jgi:hypothetical protein
MQLDQTYNWNADRLKNPTYKRPSFYLCLEMPHVFDTNCQEVGKKMQQLGHSLETTGEGYSIVRLKWDGVVN